MKSPFTLICQKTGRIGRITPKAGRIKRGEGSNLSCSKSMAYFVSGRIGRIGRIIATYAYAREGRFAHKEQAPKFIERLQTSSLSSLSSLTGKQGIDNKRKAIPVIAVIILPAFGVILPILPEVIGTKQDVVSSKIEGTK